MSNYFWFGGEETPYLVSKSTRFDESKIQRTPVENDYYQYGESAEIIAESTSIISSNTITGITQIPETDWVKIKMDQQAGVTSGQQTSQIKWIPELGQFWRTGLSGGSQNYIMSSVDGYNWENCFGQAGTRDIYDFNYGNGVIIFTCNNGYILRCNNPTASGNSKLYTNVYAGTGNMFGIAYGNGVWAMAGSSSRTYYSTDNGSTWTQGTNEMGEYNSPKGVSYGNGVWVMVDQNQAVLTSTDGKDWKYVNSSTSTNVGWGLVIWTGELFYAPTKHSYNGIDWIINGNSGGYYIGYGGGLYISATGVSGPPVEHSYSLGPGSVWTSKVSNILGGTPGVGTNGTTIVASTSSSNSDVNVATEAYDVGKTVLDIEDTYNEGFWSGMSIDDNGGDAGPANVISSDNVELTCSYDANFAIGENIRANNIEVLNLLAPIDLDTDLKTELFAAGDTVNQSESYLATTDNVSDVTSVSIGLDNWNVAVAAATSRWIGVTYGDGKFVAVANNGTLAMNSTDGISWTATNIIGNTWSSVAYGNGTFVAVSSQTGSGDVMYSTDGSFWLNIDSTNTSQTWRDVTYADGKFVAVGNFGTTSNTMSSTDGINWTAGINDGGSWGSVAYGNGVFTIIPNNGTNTTKYSTDGFNWSPAPSAVVSDGLWQSVTYGNGTFVAVASSGTRRVMYSTDAINWSIAYDVPESNPWKEVTYGDGMFVAVSETGTNQVMYSTNGINWTASTAGANTDWQSVTYGDGKFVAVAFSGTNQVMYAPLNFNTQVTLGGSTNLGFFDVGTTVTQPSTELSAPISSISSNVMTFGGVVAFTTGSPLTTNSTASSTVTSVGINNDLMVVKNTVGKWAINKGRYIKGTVRREPKYQSETGVLTAVDDVVGYEIPQSVVFNDTTGTHYLDNTPSTNGNRRTWTWSGWLKKTENNVNQYVMSAGNPTQSDILFSGGLWFDDTTTTPTTSIGVEEPTDVSDWFHLVVAFDTTQSIASDRVKLYINGVQPTLTLADYPNQNEEGQFSSTVMHIIGSYYVPANGGVQGGGYSGYLADVNFIDGLALEPTAFGRFNPFGQWIAKDYEDPQLLGTITTTVGDTQLTVSSNSNFGVLEVGSGIKQDSGHTPETSAITNVSTVSYTSGIQGTSGTDWYDAEGANGGSLFDGSTSTRIYPAAGKTITVNFSPPLSGTCEFWSDHSTGQILYTEASGGVGSTNTFYSSGEWFMVGEFESVTQMRFSQNTAQGFNALAIRINGEILTDGGAEITLTDDTDLANFRVGDAVQLEQSQGEDVGTIYTPTRQWESDGSVTNMTGSQYDGILQSKGQEGPTQTYSTPIPVTDTLVINGNCDYSFSGQSFEVVVTGAGGTVTKSITSTGSGYVTLEYTSAELGGQFVGFSTTNGGPAAGYIYNFVVDGNTLVSTTYLSQISVTAIDESAPSITTNGGTWTNGETVIGPALLPGVGEVTSINTPTNTINYTLDAGRFISGQSKTVSKVNPHGTNGFHLPFESSDIGNDVAMGNDFTPNNITSADVVVDSPTDYGTDTGLGGEVRGNYPTSVVTATGGGTLSDGNLTTNVTSGTYGATESSIRVNSGKWYWECKSTFGFRMGAQIGGGGVAGAGEFSYALDTGSGNKVNQNTSTAYFAGSASVGEWHGVALDLDAGTISFYPEGIDAGVAFSNLPLGDYYTPCASESSSSAGSATFNFTFNYGQRPFAYQAPAGYKAINTLNLT